MNQDARSRFPDRKIVGMRVHATNYDQAVETILEWAAKKESRSVCAASVNNVMIAKDDPTFLATMNEFDLITSDGMPLVWGLKALRLPDATRVYGPTLTLKLCARAAALGVSVGFYGGTPDVMERLVSSLRREFPTIRIGFRHCPPFRPTSRAEDEAVVKELQRSDTHLLFVGLGCPKQERWIARNVSSAGAVMLAVGAAFDFIAGEKKQAPQFLQRMGLEWLFRLSVEPRRLWRRYLYQNPRFIILFGKQLYKEFRRRGGNHR